MHALANVTTTDHHTTTRTKTSNSSDQSHGSGDHQHGDGTEGQQNTHDDRGQARRRRPTDRDCSHRCAPLMVVTESFTPTRRGSKPPDRLASDERDDRQKQRNRQGAQHDVRAGQRPAGVHSSGCRHSIPTHEQTPFLKPQPALGPMSRSASQPNDVARPVPEGVGGSKNLIHTRGQSRAASQKKRYFSLEIRFSWSRHLRWPAVPVRHIRVWGGANRTSALVASDRPVERIAPPPWGDSPHRRPRARQPVREASTAARGTPSTSSTCPRRSGSTNRSRPPSVFLSRAMRSTSWSAEIDPAVSGDVGRP